MKGKFQKTVVRPEMMYGQGYWLIKKKKELKMKLAEIRILKLM